MDVRQRRLQDLLGLLLEWQDPAHAVSGGGLLRYATTPPTTTARLRLHPGIGGRFPYTVSRWFTIDQTAERLGYDPATVFALVASGWLPHVFVRGELLVPEIAASDVAVDSDHTSRP